MNQHLLDRMRQYTAPQEVRDMGWYPYFREIDSEQDTEVIIGGKPVMMFGSNSYLGLTNHPKIKEAAKAATDKYGTGCAGSRFLNGTLRIHVELEEMLADYLKQEAVLLYSTGFQSNLGAIAPLAGRHDYILIDERVHASIIDATRLSFAKVQKFRHNDMEDFERKMAALDASALKYVIVDGIFSMEGDIAKLPDIVRIARQHNGAVVVDDAHAIGVIGKGGIGTASHFNMLDQVDIQTGTFSKSLASLGGFVASNRHVIEYLKHTSRALIFSASMTPAAAGSVMAALEIMRDEPERIERLWENTNYALARFLEMGFEVGPSESPIIPIYVRDNLKTFAYSTACFESGVFINHVVSPAVPSEESLIRFSLMATHTTEQIDRAIDRMYDNALKLGIVGSDRSEAPAEVFQTQA